VDDFEDIARKSLSDESALLKLHEFGATPILAIKSLVTGRGLSLKEAKEKLLNSPCWKAEAENANNLHLQIDALLDDYEGKASDFE
jgi:ribosomal protein L7/L12